MAYSPFRIFEKEPLESFEGQWMIIFVFAVQEGVSGGHGKFKLRRNLLESHAVNAKIFRGLSGHLVSSISNIIPFSLKVKNYFQVYKSAKSLILLDYSVRRKISSIFST